MNYKLSDAYTELVKRSKLKYFIITSLLHKTHYRPTVVHKFFIRNTIEENIYHATARSVEDWDSNNVTLGRIKQLFEVSTVPQESSPEETVENQETAE